MKILNLIKYNYNIKFNKTKKTKKTDGVQVATPITVELLLAIPCWFYNIGDE